MLSVELKVKSVSEIKSDEVDDWRLVVAEDCDSVPALVDGDAVDVKEVKADE